MIEKISAGSMATILLLAAWIEQAGAETAVFAPSKDNTLYEDVSGTLSNGAGANIFAGQTAANSTRRALLAFDVGSQIPGGSVINSASLDLTVNRAAVSPVVEVSVHPVLADWGEGTSDAALQEGGGTTATIGDATWTNRFFPGEFWDQIGGDFDPLASATRTVQGAGHYTWSSPELTADVQNWLDSPAGNFGWILIGDEGSASTSRRFGSRENPDPNVRPVLTVDYTPPAQASLVLTATVNQTGFATGGTLELSISATNPGQETDVDVYLVILLPDGNTMVNFVGLDGAFEFGSFSALGSLTPLVGSLTLSGAFDVSIPSFFSYTWSGAEPAGDYQVFLVMAQAGSLADGSIDPGDLIQFGAASFGFNP